jgi:mono/diheme cytochrome c family protein
MIKIIPGIISLILVFQGFNLYQKKTFKQSILDGQEIYYDFCVRCHLPSGIGEQGRVPPLAESDYLINNIEMSIRGLKYGLSGPIVVNGEEYNGVMQDQGLDDDEIADVMNYILNNWGNEHKEMVTEKQVASTNE